MRTAARRSRVVHLALLALIVALGLASRVYRDALPRLVGLYAGDTLWAAAVLLGLGAAWPAVRTRSLAAAAALIAFVVEVGQLAHPAWLEPVRRHPLVRLLLGYDFVLSDLACYGAGVMLGAAIDRLSRHALVAAPPRSRRPGRSGIDVRSDV